MKEVNLTARRALFLIAKDLLGRIALLARSGQYTAMNENIKTLEDIMRYLDKEAT